MFSSSVFSVSITTDEIVYTDESYSIEDLADEPKYAEFITYGNCEDPIAEEDTSRQDTELSLFLADTGLTVRQEIKTFLGSSNWNFTSHYEGYWSMYDDINRKIIRSWDSLCMESPRDLTLETNVLDVKKVIIFKELNSGYVESHASGNLSVMLDEPSDIDWSRELSSRNIIVLDTIDKKTYAKAYDESKAELWEINPEIKKISDASIHRYDEIMKTEAGITSVSIRHNIVIHWLEKKVDNRYIYEANGVNGYQLHPLYNGSILAVNTINGWSFRWLVYGKKYKNIPYLKEINTIISCNKSEGNVFCFDLRDTGEVYIWRLSPVPLGVPNFSLDSIISQNYFTEDTIVKDIKVSKDYRVVFVEKDGIEGVFKVDSHSSSYLALNENITSFRARDDTSMFVSVSDNELTVLTVSADNDSVFVRSLVSSSDVLPEEAQVISPDEVEANPVEETTNDNLEEREDSSSEEEEPRPRAELSGAISMYYLFAMMLVLLIGRRKA
jgi:hypothetical protein